MNRERHSHQLAQPPDAPLEYGPPSLWHRALGLRLLSMILTCYAVAALLSVVLPVGQDWNGTFYPATRAFWSAQNPYHEVGTFVNPIWTLVGLGPFAIDFELGSAAMYVITFSTYIYVVRYFGGGLVEMALYLTMPTTLFLLQAVNVDWMAMLGITLSPSYGLLLAMIKPQIGLGVAIYWCLLTWRQRGLMHTVRMVLPLSILGALSLLVYGFPNFDSASEIQDKGWNFGALFWPYGIGFAVVLLAWAVVRAKKGYALLASPFLLPYFGVHSWGATLVAFAGRRWLVFGTWLAMWSFIFINI